MEASAERVSFNNQFDKMMTFLTFTALAGFKFDEQEAAAVKENKKMQKAALGLQDSDDDDDLENDIDQQIENMFAAKRNIKEIEAPVAPVVPPPIVNPNLPVASQTDKLELAKRLASRINIAKNLGFEAKGATQQAAEAILKGGPTQSLITVSPSLNSSGSIKLTKTEILSISGEDSG